MERAGVKTIWSWEKYDRDGKLVSKWIEKNLVTDEGLDYLLSVGFKDGAKITSWYLLTFEDDYTPDGSETYAVPGFTECEAIDEVDRPACVLGSVSSQAVDNNANKATFTYSASKTIYGGALVGGGTDPDTIGDTAGGGKLYCVSRFTSGSKPVEDDEVLKVTVTLQIQDV